jgi:hypothetical protein
MARLSHIRNYVAPSELARAVAGIKRRLAGGASSMAAGAQSPDSSAAPEPPASEELAPPVQEKKKSELPSSLKSAFSSLAATFNVNPAGSVPAATMPLAEASPPIVEAAPPPPAEEENEEGEDMWASDPPHVPATAPATAGALRAAVIAAVGKTSPLLKSGLASSLEWKLEAERLIIPFKNGMEESLVRGELPSVSRAVTQAAGRNLKVDLRVEKQTESSGGGGPEASVPVEIAVVERVFRGQFIPEKAPKKNDGGSDGF